MIFRQFLKNKKFYTALLFVLISALFFLASASSVLAAGCGKNQGTFPSSYFDPLISFAEKTIKGFGFNVSLAAEPDPDFCGQDIIFGCAATNTPYGGISWEPAAAIISGGYTTTWLYLQTYQYFLNGEGPFPISAGSTFAWLWTLNNNTTYNWTVEAFYGASNLAYNLSSTDLGFTDQPHGSFTTSDCTPPPPPPPPPPITYELSVTKSGNSLGTVTSAPSGINCGTTCLATYSPNTSVTLTASPITGIFSGGWCNYGSIGTCNVTMSMSKTVNAEFSDYTLSVTKTGNGSGTVTSYPAGINCGFGGGTDCTENYTSGTSVTLTADKRTNSTFTGWSGGSCSGTNTTCTVIMSVARTVTATFTLNSYTLSVTKAGNGSGTVTGAGTYIFNTVVTATASANSGSTFTGWSGNCNANGQVTMTENKTCTATFTLNGPGGFTLSLGGTVTCNSVPLTWTASSGAVGYKILKGSPRVDISPYQPYTGLNFTDASVSQNTSYTYQVEAYNGGGTIRSNTISPTTPYCPPTVDLSANPMSIYQGQSSILSWTTTYTSPGSSCTASGGTWSGSKTGSGGNETVYPSPPPSATYNLSCSGPGGSASDSVTIEILPLGLPGWREIIPR